MVNNGMREEAETGTPLEPGVPLETLNWQQMVESLRKTIEQQAAVIDRLLQQQPQQQQQQPEEEEVELVQQPEEEVELAQQPEEDKSVKHQILQIQQELRQLKRKYPQQQQQQQQPQQWLGPRRRRGRRGGGVSRARWYAQRALYNPNESKPGVHVHYNP